MPHRPKIRYAISKRLKNSIISIIILLLVFLVGLDHSPARNKWRHLLRPQGQSAVYDVEKYNTKTFVVTKAVDGDTIDIAVSDGKNMFTRVRLLGVDTPETHDERTGVMYFGPQAAEFTAGLTAGKKVRVYLDTATGPARDKYGRLLAYVLLPDGRFLNDTLLNEGLAYADLRFKHSRFYEYKQLETAARNSRKGLWKNVTRDQLPKWLQNENPKLLLKKNS